MIRYDLRFQRGFQRFCGIGILVRPEQTYGGRWYVKFPCSPETYFSTGRRGNCELCFVIDLLNHETDIDTLDQSEFHNQESEFLQEAKQFGSMTPFTSPEKAAQDEVSEEEQAMKKVTMRSHHSLVIARGRIPLICVLSAVPNNSILAQMRDLRLTLELFCWQKQERELEGEREMDDYRFRLILARMQADPNSFDPTKKKQSVGMTR